MNYITFLSVFVLSCLINIASAQPSSTSVFHANRSGNKQWLTYQDNYRALYRIITNEAFKQLDERADFISGLKSEADWRYYQEKAKVSLCSSLMKFKKTPLNARTTGGLERESFTVEKVLFESHPGFYVTACLFLPKDRQKPAPTIVFCSGHSDLGFRTKNYQHEILNLVNKGFIVFAFDPIGQGERLQYPDSETGKSKIGGPTKEHSYAGIQTLFTGTSLTEYFIWDGVRVLDYLETRKEVDMKRIGITGNSGGGTQSAQIAACDDRIYAAAPKCYITSFRRLLQSIGAQDAEQNPYNAVAKGFDHPDYLHIRAPKPTLIVTTTNDFFSIQGARETFAEVQKSYTAFGKTENIQMVEDMGIHESTLKNREAVYAFFQKHLNLPGDNTDVETSPFLVDELRVTPTGQVSTSYKCETVFSLNQKYFSKETVPENKLKEQIVQTSGTNFERKLTSAVYTGKFSKNGMEIEKYFLENHRKDFALPVYVIKKEGINLGKILLWFHPDGKEKLLDEPLLSELLNAGNIVVSTDLPGIGELHDPEFTGDGVIEGVLFNYTFAANLTGKSIPGIQTEAINLLMQFVENDKRFFQEEKYALVQGTAASAFLHFAVLNNTFKKVAFLDFPGSAMNQLRTEFYDPETAFSIAPGSLQYYDITDLVKLLIDSQTTIIIHEPTKEPQTKKEQVFPEIVDFFHQ